MITVSLRKAQSNLDRYLNDLESGALDKVIITDDDLSDELAQLVTYAVYAAADPGLSAPMISQPQLLYTRERDGLYQLVKTLRDHDAAQVAEAQTASCVIQAIAKANIVDHETFTLLEYGGADQVFAFDVLGDGTPEAPAYSIDVSGATTAADVAAAIAQTINGTGGWGSATVVNSDQVQVLQRDPGPDGNQSNLESVADAGFTVSDFIGGADAPKDTSTIEAMNVFGIKRTINDDTPRAVIVPTKHAEDISL